MTDKDIAEIPIVEVGSPGAHGIRDERSETSLLLLLNVLLIRRRLILAFALVGALLGGLAGLSTKRTFTAGAKFLPKGSDMPGGSLGLALAASQFGIRVPEGSGAWSPAVYVDLIRSASLLERIVSDTITVVEEDRRTTLVDLLEADGETQPERVATAAILLRNMIQARESRSLNGVELTVTTRWPSVSFAIAQRVLAAVHSVNMDARRSQAAAEMAFVKPLLDEAQRDLKAAEERLNAFQLRNRIMKSPELTLEQDRLQRDVTLQQQLYNSVLQNYEEARMQENRNTPVITVIQAPRPPVLPNSRKTVVKAGVGGLAGGLLGFMLAFALHGLAMARRRQTPEVREFFRLLRDATPRFGSRRDP